MADGDYQQFRLVAKALDVDLVARARAHDHGAFEDIYRSYRPRLARFLTTLLKRPALVEEVMHDTMLTVWQKLESFRGDSALSTWIFAIAYRKGARALQRNDDPVDDAHVYSLADRDANPEEAAGVGRKQRQLATALGKLSADHRAVIDLTYFHELGYREIAEIMACPVDTVKTRMFHARRHLKSLLAGEKTDWL